MTKKRKYKKKQTEIPIIAWIGIILSGIIALSLFIWAFLIKFGII